MSKIKQLASETAIYGLGSVLPKLLNFILATPYLTRVLENGEYGIHGIIYAYTALIMAVITLRLETAFFRFASREGGINKSFSTTTSVVLLSTLLFVSLVFFNASNIASWITTAEDARYVQWFAFIIGFDAMAAIPFAKLRLENRPVRFAVIKIINVLVTIVIILFFLELCSRSSISDPDGFLAGLYQAERSLDYVFLANLAASIIVVILLIPEFRKFRFSLDKVLIKNMLRYSWPLVLVGVAAAINQVFDRVFIAELMPGTPEENQVSSGVYNGASKVAIIMSLFATAFNYAAEPFFFKNFKSKDEASTYGKVAHAFLLTGSIVFLTISLFIDQAQFLIGKDYREGIYIVPVLLLAYLFLGLYYNFSIWYKLKDKTLIGAVIAFIGAAITIGLNIVLIPKVGMIGASYAVLTCFVSMCSLALFFGKKYYPIKYPLVQMIGYLLLAIILYIIGINLKTVIPNPWTLFGINLVILISYLLAVYAGNKNLLKN